MSYISNQEHPQSPTLDSPTQEFIRLPKPGGRFYGLSRSYIEELCTSGKVRSSLIKKRGARKGLRLIHLASLRDFILSQDAGITPKEVQEGGN